jgi:hypothetical protein
MWMSDGQQKAHPVLAAHLRDDFPKFLESGLVPALKKYGDYANLDQLGLAFTWGSDKSPVVEVYHSPRQSLGRLQARWCVRDTYRLSGP